MAGYESGGANQRVSIDPAAALMSSGNSRNTKRILPVSMNSDLIFGNTFSVNAAQCGQVIEAYSVIVTVALAGPSTISGRDCGLATSAAPCAIASVISRSGEKRARAVSPVSDRAAVKARRVIIKGCSRVARSRPKEVRKEAFASLKRQLWQWRVASNVSRQKLKFS